MLPNIHTLAYVKYEEQRGKEFEEYKYYRVLLYDNTLRYLDQAIEEFYSYLEKLGYGDNTIFIITAYHGEEF